MFAYSVEPGTRALGERQHGPAVDRISRARLKSRERHVVADSGAFHLWQRFEARCELRKEVRLLRRGRIARARDIDECSRDATRLEARLRTLQVHQAHEKQRRSYE